ncbi:hypothetical protein JIN77_09860 [Verrucomicrobiaceae bacterium R5-34]|uniref:NusG-like N-terminal domain-containing protein n=1 Tax=Oceaniferula flava TaxID=2800421 RepID=A0AAE2SDR6_9BACT|nr:transcription termination/antitermination NusG family protein [Oceaniferula flavus]MBK1831030.1 hypothetical protein [Verrucomicrobiaceae bacterium R5-34]MBK1855547.1 hypothetical protein [Oceaniferula flavus]MBM1136853.1 hypothetical protein [Oceaniferula flavus]
MADIQDSDDSPAWYCVRTQTKREHLAAKSLKQLEGIESFCPRLRYRKATRRGKIWWVEAMFPGYIFAFFSRKQSERLVVHTPGVMKLLKFGDYVPEIKATFVAELVRQMQEQDEEGNDMLTLQPTVKEGDEVEIAHGAMQGIQGKVVEVLPSQERVKLLVEFLGSDQLVDADLFSLLLPSKPLPED